MLGAGQEAKRAVEAASEETAAYVGGAAPSEGAAAKAAEVAHEVAKEASVASKERGSRNPRFP